MTVEFHYGALSDPFEEQANRQGLTLGNKAKWIQKMWYGLITAHINGCVTDAEFDKIIQRFQKKILLKNLKTIDKHTGGKESEE